MAMVIPLLLMAMAMLQIARLWRGNGDEVAADGDCVAIAMTMPVLPMASDGVAMTLLPTAWRWR